VKEVVGAGRQQVRRMRASVGAFHVCLWAFGVLWEWGTDGLQYQYLPFQAFTPLGA
jgi:hypothetical protein